MTRTEAMKLCAYLQAAYPHVQVGDATVAVYAAELADIDVGLAERAARQLVRESRWFPTVAAIRATVDALGPRKAIAPYHRLLPRESEPYREPIRFPTPTREQLERIARGGET